QTLVDYQGVGQILNPLLVLEEVNAPTSQFRMLGNMFAEYTILKSLKLRTTFGADYNGSQRDFFRSSRISSASLSEPASGDAASNRALNWLNENTLTYAYKDKQHRVDAVGGFTVQ